MPADVTSEFMPIYEVGKDRLHGFEALARGPHGERFPELYDSAKRAGELDDLDRRCLRAALLAATSLSSDYRMFVNVLPSSISEGRAFSELDQARMRPEQIVLEIVPFELIEDYPRLSSALRRIEQLGCRFALDGFGTGYSSLAQLTRLPLHYVKFAPCLLDPSDRGASDLPQAVQEMANAIALRCVVTGIDSEAHLSTALNSGAGYVQGFYVGKPSALPQAVSSLSMLKRARLLGAKHRSER